MKAPRAILALLLALSLASCMSYEEKMAAQNTLDDQQCLSYGATRGSDAYVNCRAQLDSARNTAHAIAVAAAVASIPDAPAPQGPRPGMCNPLLRC